MSIPVIILDKHPLSGIKIEMLCRKIMSKEINIHHSRSTNESNTYLASTLRFDLLILDLIMDGKIMIPYIFRTSV